MNIACINKDIDFQYDHDEDHGVIFECKEYIPA